MCAAAGTTRAAIPEAVTRVQLGRIERAIVVLAVSLHGRIELVHGVVLPQLAIDLLHAFALEPTYLVVVRIRRVDRPELLAPRHISQILCLFFNYSLLIYLTRFRNNGF